MLMLDDEKFKVFVEDIVLQVLEKHDEKPSSRKWLNLGESAIYLGVSRNTLKKFIINSDIKLYVIGGIKRILQSDLDAFVISRSIESDK